MRLLYDNARPHKTKLVKSELDKMRADEQDDPPYSPHLAPSDLGSLKVEKGPCRQAF